MAEADETRRALRISCADALELMTDHLEGVLTPADLERLQAHLAGCEPCSIYLDQLRATIRIAAGDGLEREIELDPDRAERLTELFRREHHE